MSYETTAIVKSTAPALKVYGLAITQIVYECFFIHPKVKAMLDQAAQESEEQPCRLAYAILASAIEYLQAGGIGRYHRQYCPPRTILGTNANFSGGWLLLDARDMVRIVDKPDNLFALGRKRSQTARRSPVRPSHDRS